MISKILERWRDGEYETENGKELFEIDMSEANERLIYLEDILSEVECDIRDLLHKLK